MEDKTAKVRAFSVHIFTACGGALALLALFEATQAAWPQMFLWLAAALVIDGVDGSLARRLHVSELLPRWSGDVLDLVIDFTTYVFVPAFAIAASGLLPPFAGLGIAIAVVISGGIYFADREMKQPGHYFRGFPALWNGAAFYLFLLKPPPWIAVAALVVLVGLTFAPFRFIHPVRVRRLRPLNILLAALWSVLALVAILRGFAPGRWIVAGLCATGLYFLLFGLVRWRRTQD